MSAGSAAQEAIGLVAPTVLVVLLVLFCAALAASSLAEADIDRDVHP
jgi:hypothetical protein